MTVSKWQWRVAKWLPTVAIWRGDLVEWRNDRQPWEHTSVSPNNLFLVSDSYCGCDWVPLTQESQAEWVGVTGLDLSTQQITRSLVNNITARSELLQRLSSRFLLEVYCLEFKSNCFALKTKQNKKKQLFCTQNLNVSNIFKKIIS